MFAPFHRNYLGGMDWFAAALSDQCRHTPGRGQHFLIVLEAEGVGMASRIRGFLEQLGPILPWLGGWIARHRLNLAPYWHPGDARPVPLDHLVVRDEAAFDQALERFANMPLPPLAAVAAMTVETGDRCRGMFKFSHVLFDGRGGEMFLNELGRAPDRMLRGFPEHPSAGLTDWVNKFRSGRRVNRARLAILADRKVAGWPASRGGRGGTRCRRIYLDAGQTASLAERAEREIGPFMLTPFLGASLGKALAGILDGRGMEGDILLQMSTDLRGYGCPIGARYLNQWSLAPLLLRREDARVFEAGVRSMQSGIMDSVRTGFLRDFRETALLWRILPVPVFSRLVSRLLRKDAGTCLFSHIPGTSLSLDAPVARGVRNLFHVPLVPPAPGLGVIFSGFRGCLNGVISYRDGIMSEPEVDALARRLADLLT